VFFPQPRLDFYACVQAKKRKDSPHGAASRSSSSSSSSTTTDTDDDASSEQKPVEPVIGGLRYKPKIMTNPVTKEELLGPFY